MQYGHSLLLQLGILCHLQVDHWHVQHSLSVMALSCCRCPLVLILIAACSTIKILREMGIKSLNGSHARLVGDCLAAMQ